MLMGEYQHNMDAKGRVTIPAKFRDDLGERFYVSRGLDGCLSVANEAQFMLQVEKIAASPSAQAKNVARYLFSGADTVEPDKQGRILISPGLRAFAGLTKDVTVIGVGTTAEIWDTERWRQFSATLSDESILADMNALQL